MNAQDDYSLSPATRTPRSWWYEAVHDLLLVLAIVGLIVFGPWLSERLSSSEPEAQPALDLASYERGRAEATAELAQTVGAAYAQGQRDKQCGARP